MQMQLGLYVLIVCMLVVHGQLQLDKLVGKSSSKGNSAVEKKAHDVMGMVHSVWEEVVEKHQDGLLDPRASSLSASSSLSAEEAWYHYSASQKGVVDSARYVYSV
jgi:hypothetical protein